MKKILKWVIGLCGGLIALTILVLLLAPFFIDLKDYKPFIEQKVSTATGRSFSIGDDISLSLFPWAGISLTDLNLGNPPGFEDKEMLSIDAFQVQVKLLPLLFKDIQVKRFIVEAPRLSLVQKKDGRSNWESIGKPATPSKPAQDKQPPSEPGAAAIPQIPLAALYVGELVINKGEVRYVDQKTDQQTEVADLNLKLADVSFDKPVQIDFSALIDQKPIAVKGQLGPLGKDFLTRNIPLEMKIKALGEFESAISGHISNIIVQPQFKLAVETNEFSPQKLLAAIGPESVVKTSDPDVLQKASLKANISGTPKTVSLSDGVMVLDDSHINFIATARDFNRPNLTFDIKLDAINVDRYLPPESESGDTPSAPAAPKSKPAQSKQTDYSPLRKMILNGTFSAARMTASRAHMESLQVKLVAKDGLIRISPLSFNFYQGSVSATSTLDVRKRQPATAFQLKIQGVQAKPLLKDVLEKDILEGTMKSELNLKMVGDLPETIKRSLNGKGHLHFSDGAIVGIDIAGMVRNVKSAFVLGSTSGEKPRTDFTELAIPFTITNGLFHTPDTQLASPLLRLKANGDADLAKETIDMRVEPKVVATLVGQGDTQQRSGVVEVPVLVSGTFDSPTFRPDLKALLEKQAEQKVSSEIDKLTEGKDDGSIEKKAGNLIKGFMDKE